MVSTLSYDVTESDGGRTNTELLLGDPGRKIVPCVQQDPTMQDIINSVRNTVDESGNPAFQAVAVPVHNLPHDLQVILDQGGALDWVRRSIDEVVFSHNILVTTNRDGQRTGFRTGDGLSLQHSKMAPESQSQFEGKRTIYVVVPRGDEDSRRTTSPGYDSSAGLSFSARELAETASIIVHETQHKVDDFNSARNVPHEYPLREKRFYDRFLAKDQALEINNLEQRAVEAQGLFVDEISMRSGAHLTELPNNLNSWNELHSSLQAMQEKMLQYLVRFRVDANPLRRLDARTEMITSKMVDACRDKIASAKENVFGPSKAQEGFDSSPFAQVTPPPGPPTDFEIWKALRGNPPEVRFARTGGETSPLQGINASLVEPPSTQGFVR